MTEAIEAAPAVGVAVLVALMVGMAALFAWDWIVGGDGWATWQPGELAAVAIEEEPPGPGRHRMVAERACDQIAGWTRYQPRHNFGEVPPSLRSLAALMPVGLRAVIVARAVNPRWWPKPHATRAALEAWGRRVAQRHGIACQLGRFARPVGTVLP